jgi:Fe-S oxidoreductase
LTVFLMEPTSGGKRRHCSETLMNPAGFEQVSQEEVKQKLKEIRRFSLANLNAMISELTANLTNHLEIEYIFAQDAKKATETICKIAQGGNLAINRSAVINNELRPMLIDSGLKIIDAYFDEFNLLENAQYDGWKFPEMPFESRFQSFGKPVDLTLLREQSIQNNGIKNFTGLLGVNVISSDGTVIMLQHLQNISKIFQQAKELILVASLDKIVNNQEDALFQTKCVAVFGSEVLPFKFTGGEKINVRIDDLPFEAPGDRISPKIHLILLDNGRSQILQSPYKDLLACIDCRRCNGSCPAYLSDKPLLPSELSLKFRRELLEIRLDLSKPEEEIMNQPLDIDMRFISPEASKDEIWDCTTCGNCNEICPAEVKPVNTIGALRGSMVMEKAEMPALVSQALRSIEDRGHPWRGTLLTRTDWTEGIEIKTLAEDDNIDLLYWVGCTQALEIQSTNIAKAMGKLFKLAGIKAGILGSEEACCGEPARRLGNEYLFQLQARKNIERLKNYQIKKIVTACPHCFNTLKNEYPVFGGEFEVASHVQFIADLIKDGRLKIQTNEKMVVTYHDPCYLGRYNGIYDPPRQILINVPNITLSEMKLNREQSFCCGGGGGHMWMQDNRGKRIGDMRFEQAIDTGAQTLITACPFCKQMFDDAARDKAGGTLLQVMDFAELVIRTAI